MLQYHLTFNTHLVTFIETVMCALWLVYLQTSSTSRPCKFPFLSLSLSPQTHSSWFSLLNKSYVIMLFLFPVFFCGNLSKNVRKRTILHSEGLNMLRLAADGSDGAQELKLNWYGLNTIYLFIPQYHSFSDAIPSV